MVLFKPLHSLWESSSSSLSVTISLLNLLISSKWSSNVFDSCNSPISRLAPSSCACNLSMWLHLEVNDSSNSRTLSSSSVIFFSFSATKLSNSCWVVKGDQVTVLFSSVVTSLETDRSDATKICFSSEESDLTKMVDSTGSPRLSLVAANTPLSSSTRRTIVAILVRFSIMLSLLATLLRDVTNTDSPQSTRSFLASDNSHSNSSRVPDQAVISSFG